MVETYRGYINIGGEITREQLRTLKEKFLDELSTEMNVQMNIPENPVFETSDLPGCSGGRSMITDEEGGHLWITNPNANHGSFPSLERWLEQNDIPYTRNSDGYYEFDPQTKKFRPGYEVVEGTIQQDPEATGGDMDFSASRILSMIKRAENLEDLRRTVRKKAGKDLPSLPEFTVTNE